MYGSVSSKEQPAGHEQHRPSAAGSWFNHSKFGLPRGNTNQHEKSWADGYWVGAGASVTENSNPWETGLH